MTSCMRPSNCRQKRITTTLSIRSAALRVRFVSGRTRPKGGAAQSLEKILFHSE